jgi:hypothetical protein
LRDDPILGAELARQAKQDVREFTWDKRAMRILKMFAEAQASAAGPHSAGRPMASS